jgi:hypothetical protein
VVLKNKYCLGIFLGFVSSALVMSSALALPDEYRPSEFLTLDLSKAALSPKPLGPPNTFGSVSSKARTDGEVTGSHAHARPAQSLGRTDLARTDLARTDHPSAVKPRGTARTRLAHRRNPLDAQAMDTRIQVWPCKSGALCKWKQ